MAIIDEIEAIRNGATGISTGTQWDMAVLIIMAVSIVFVAVAFLEAVRAVGE